MMLFFRFDKGMDRRRHQPTRLGLSNNPLRQVDDDEDVDVVADGPATLSGL